MCFIHKQTEKEIERRKRRKEEEEEEEREGMRRMKK